MTTRTAAAWEQIRAADPMASIDVNGASQQPAAQELLHRITADASAAPDGQADVLTLVGGGPIRVSTPRRRGLAAGLAAAVVVVLATVTVVAVRHDDATTAPAAPSPTTAQRQTTAPPQTAAQQRTTAAGYSKALLAELPLPTGARRVNQPPIPELKQTPATGNGILDSQVAWWTVPGSFSAAVARMGNASARPAHWNNRVGSTGSAGSPSRGWLIEVRDPGSRFVSSVNITVAAHGTKVGLAAQVDTYAIAVRTPGQVIPASTDSASFAMSGRTGASYSSTLILSFSGKRVTSLARMINATPTFVVLLQVPCPAPQGSVTVTFRHGSQRWVLNVTAGSSLCNTPTLTGADGKTVNLAPSTALITDVLAAAGLPSNYFSR